MTITPLTAIRERAEKARKLVDSVPGTKYEWIGCDLEIADSPWGALIEADRSSCAPYNCCGGHSTIVDKNAKPFLAASPTLVRELLDTQERLIRALESAVDQRNDNFADMEDSGIITTKQGQVFRAQDDAALAAILEPKVTP